MEAVLIMIICVLMNHLGLIEAIEGVVKRKLPILNCCKCSTFWFVSIYLVVTTRTLILPVFIGLMLSYVAIWVELGFGIIDKYYDQLYEKIYGNGIKDNNTSSGHEDRAESPVSEM